MDMSFARRRKVPVKTDTPDLSVLLAEVSARQGSSRTALTQAGTQAENIIGTSDSLIDIFAPAGKTTATTHRFSDQIANPVIPRKLI